MKVASIFFCSPCSGWGPKDRHEYSKRYSCTDAFTEEFCIKENMKLVKKEVDCLGGAFQNLKDLIEDCNKVLANHDLAEELMPTTPGFFFGSEEYDEYYFDNLKETVEKLQPIADAANKEHDHFIYSDWW